MLNPHEDGISLDTVVDWLVQSGQQIRRIDDYKEWLIGFKMALVELPQTVRRESVLPLLDAYAEPLAPARAASAPTEQFQRAVHAAKVGVIRNTPPVIAFDREVCRRYPPT